jgi:protocatechuate 3,4-dioxygenase alpha subunit
MNSQLPANAAESASSDAAFGQTPWQTVGPFFHFFLPWSGCADLRGSSQIGARADLIPSGHQALQGPDRSTAGPPSPGDRIEISGRVLDARAAPVADALLEIWQANASGYYRGSTLFPQMSPQALDAAFFGFGRAATAEDGTFCFRTLRPGRVPVSADRRELQAPHVALGVLGRGLLKRLVTRIYFADEPGNAQDPVLACVPERRRATLIASRLDAPAGDSTARYRFDVRLQGEHETVFFHW